MSARRLWINVRGGSRTDATSKMELFMIIVNAFQQLTIITKSSILTVAAVICPPLNGELKFCDVRDSNPLAICHLHYSLLAVHKKNKNKKKPANPLSRNMNRSHHLCFHVLEK